MICGSCQDITREGRQKGEKYELDKKECAGTFAVPCHSRALLVLREKVPDNRRRGDGDNRRHDSDSVYKG